MTLNGVMACTLRYCAELDRF